MKKTSRLLSILTILIASFVICTLHSVVRASETDTALEIQSKDIDYDLPFAGLLPDSPFYMIKQARDHLYVFFTRDNIKKAELLLHLTDKKIGMAQQLADKSKWDLVVQTLQDSENDVEKMLFSMETAQKIGSSPTPEFIIEAKTSSQKHEEIMEDFLGKAPHGTQKDIEDVIKINIEHFNRLDKL